MSHATATIKTLGFLALVGSSLCHMIKKIMATIKSMGKMNPLATTRNTVLRTLSVDITYGNAKITTVIITKKMMLNFSRMNEPFLK